MRVIEVGDFNDEFIEVKKGLKEGEKVLLRAPEGERVEAEETPATDTEIDKPPPTAPAPAANGDPPGRGREAAPAAGGAPGRDRSPAGGRRGGGPNGGAGGSPGGPR
jgi:hypothetical protein